jgi:hypothetical protein
MGKADAPVEFASLAGNLEEGLNVGEDAPADCYRENQSEDVYLRFKDSALETQYRYDMLPLRCVFDFLS